MALVRHPREDLQYDSRLPQGRGPIYNIPIEILHKFFNLFTSSPRTRDDVYTILELTHVCHFWRIALNNKPQAWATIYATRADRRGFVEACLEKSRLVLLKVEVDAYDQGPVYSLCTCDKDQRPRLIPNEIYPCEQHFVFESLTKTEHWKRIETLKIRCGRADPFDETKFSSPWKVVGSSTYPRPNSPTSNGTTEIYDTLTLGALSSTMDPGTVNS